MAQLKDLLVAGPSRLIGDVYTTNLQVNTLLAPSTSGGTTYGAGTNGQVLMSNGTSSYWGTLGSMATETATNYILKSIGTTKGDIIYWSAASTPTRLGIGTAGHFLKATANGPAYSALTSSEVTTALGNKNANQVFAGPASGSAAAPSFRSLVAADIPNLSWSKITSDKPTTLAGYGITDAKIANGVITLGSNSITPLTSHQDISGKADKSATVSTVTWDSTNKKLTKTINGSTSDVVTFTAGEGVAMAADSTSLTISANTKSTTLPDSYSYYYPLFNDSTDDDSSLLKYSTFRVTLDKGSTYGSTQLLLGNNLNSSTVGNSRGYLSFYSSGTNIIHVMPATGSYNTSYTFPSITPVGRYVVSVSSGTDSGKVGSVDLPVYINTYGVPTICEFNALQSTLLDTISPNPVIVNSSTGLSTFTDATIGQSLEDAYMQIGGLNSYTVLGATKYLRGSLKLGINGSQQSTITLTTDTPNSGTYSSTTTYYLNPCTTNGTTDYLRDVVYKVISSDSVGNSTTPVYIDVDGRAIACTLTPSSVGLSNVTNHAQINNIGLVTGESTAANNGITKTVGTTTSVAITQADLQSAIFIISDTAPDDTSVIWLKPVSE